MFLMKLRVEVLYSYVLISVLYTRCVMSYQRSINFSIICRVFFFVTVVVSYAVMLCRSVVVC